MKWLLVIAVVFVGCGGAQKAPGCDDECKRDQIIALSTQIRGWRHDARMDLEPARNNVIKFFSVPIAAAKQVCPEEHEVPKKCEDVCVLSTDICDNAENICGIAAELGAEDTWAQDKCASAKASCREAKQRCCECTKGDGT